MLFIANICWTRVVLPLKIRYAVVVNWSDEALREDLPDALARQRLLAELQPRPLSFFEEALPSVAGWPDAPSGYLVFTQGYRRFLEQAQRAGWPSQTFHAGYFHMLVDPVAVSMALIERLSILPRETGYVGDPRVP